MSKKTFLDKMRKWRKDKEEQSARAIMEKPERSTILKLFRLPGVALILGSRRYGKTATAHKISEDIHKSKGVRTMVHLPPSAPPEIRQRIQKLLPNYMKVTTKKEEWEKNSVVIYVPATSVSPVATGDVPVELSSMIYVSAALSSAFANPQMSAGIPAHIDVSAIASPMNASDFVASTSVHFAPK